MALNKKQERFAKEYLIDLNATQAAIRAGYSEKTAYSQGDRLLKHVEVAAYIQSAMDKRAERTEITADMVVSELAKLGFSDIRKLFTEDGKLKNITALPDGVAESVASVEVVTRQGAFVDDDGNREVEYIHKLKLWDKRASLELLGKHLKMFTDKVETSGEINILVQKYTDTE